MSHSNRGRRKRKDVDDGWGGQGGYMAAKILKLNEQVKGILEQGVKSSIFKGIAIFVNGYTKPTAAVLKQLVIEHGGEFHHYYKRDLVTHILATNLPNSKVANLTDKKVCKPDWITDSIKAERLLPYQDYLLYTAQSVVQPGLNFKSNPDDNRSWNQDSIPDDKELSSNSDNDRHSNLAFNSAAEIGSPENETADDLTFTEEPLVQNVTDKNHVAKLNSTSPHLGIISTKPTIKSSTCKSPPSKSSSPNFIAEFYAHSRLHHLSTWGTEFKTYVNQLQQQSNNNYPARDKLRRIVDERLDKPVQLSEKSKLSLGRAKLPTFRSIEKVILHIDMDCFFVSVGIRDKPHLKGKPVVVTHSRGKGMSSDRADSFAYESNYYHGKRCDDLDDEEETDDITVAAKKSFMSLAEIASCSYEARTAGIKNGMFMGMAIKLCPDLVPIPYDFEGYNSVSRLLYDTVAGYTHDIEAVSCDEMLVDCTDLLSDTGATPQEFASLLRQEILEKTQCNASVGMGPSILIARLATRDAKPNGQHFVKTEDVKTFIADKIVSNLPGVGHSTTKKLQQLAIITCGDMQKCSVGMLQREFGPKTGQTLYNFCRGVDQRQIKMEKERKSVSAEVNYGIRFTRISEAEKFLTDLSEEVAARLEKAGVRGKTITLKVKVRKQDAPKETAKFLGHGVCDNLAKSITVAMATDQAKVIAKEVLTLMHAMNIQAEDFRGIGIQVHRLEPKFDTKQVTGTPTILNFTVVNKPKMPDEKETEVDNCNKQQSNCGAREETLIKKRSPMKTLKSPELPPLPSLSAMTSPDTSISEFMFSKSSPVRKQLQNDFILPSPSQIDPAVLAELPVDIREQIQSTLAMYRRETPAPGRSDPEEHNSQQPGCSHWKSRNFLQSQEDFVSPEPVMPDPKQPIVALPNLSQLDPTVLTALPADLRKELEMAYAAQPRKTAQQTTSIHPLMRQNSPNRAFKKSPKKSPGKSPGKSPRKSPQFKIPRGRPPGRKNKALSPKKLEFNSKLKTNKQAVVMPSEARTAAEIEKVPKQESSSINLCGAVTLSEVKSLMKEWIESSPDPEENDLIQFVQYLSDLIHDMNLEQVYLLLKYLIRLLLRSEAPSWKHGAHFILQQTQDIVKATYGAVLSIQSCLT